MLGHTKKLQYLFFSLCSLAIIVVVVVVDAAAVFVVVVVLNYKDAKGGILSYLKVIFLHD